MILVLGRTTAFIAGLNANFEIDIKKIIALSTLRQLGIIASNLGISTEELTFLHLILHALFKSNLFICAGNFIHNDVNLQDLRLKKGIAKYIPISVSSVAVSSIALAGIPFLTGFYSKDLIIELLFVDNHRIIASVVLLLGALITVMYSLRVVFSTIHCNDLIVNISNYTEKITPITLAVISSSFLSVFIGLFIRILIITYPNTIVIPVHEKSTILFAVIVATAFSARIALKTNSRTIAKHVINLTSSMWFLNHITATFSALKINYLSFVSFSVSEQTWTEKTASLFTTPVIPEITPTENLSKINFRTIIIALTTSTYLLIWV